MKEKTIEFENVSLRFVITKNQWELTLPKSQTSVTSSRQLDLLLNPSELFAPVELSEEKDVFHFSYQLEAHWKQWDFIKKLPRNEKLRLLCNMGKLRKFLSSRITFFLHPNNLAFDDNLMPIVIYRGIRKLVPPFEMEEEAFLKQYKCFIIALFSKKYNYEQLYNGALQNANDTEFERQINEMQNLEALQAFLYESYREEQKKTDKLMEVVPIKRFRLFKQLTIILSVIVVLLAVPLIYYGFIKVPFQHHALDAHGEYLATDYGNVIATLEDEDPEKLSNQTKYILAHAYINVENLSDTEKETIMKNVSLKSDENYLLYWIYNGRGEFSHSLEKAKYIDDPQLIMYGLIKQIEQAKNNPDLTGTERDEKVSSLQDELDKYIEEYNLDPNEAGQMQEDGKQEDRTETNTDTTNSTDDEPNQNKNNN
ncbi:type VII secretion protein EssB [Virgibacillus salexigens]|uniref:Type VII secretion protein EssB n=1 Tax=Virgibacillus massiliensis TaxID=1462526 RepID=A0A024QDX5_9BACI|nr:type VII secretion protein EssB [Virgibacillus massiliensis]CDQ40395.1 type VII secretion protein EssB [Virgibacillus massiliensis]